MLQVGMELIAHHSIPSYFFLLPKLLYKRAKKVFWYYLATLLLLLSTAAIRCHRTKTFFHDSALNLQSFWRREREKIFARECVQACHVTERERERARVILIAVAAGIDTVQLLRFTLRREKY